MSAILHESRGAPLRFMPSASKAESLLQRRLRAELRGDVHFDPAGRARYATDASIYQMTPIGIAVPRDQADLIVALDIARDMKIPVLARGAGTSQCGQTIGEALIIDNSKWLNAVVRFDPQARTVTVEPGIVLDALNAWLKPHGLWFPVDVSTAAQCTLGGMAGNNSCGSRSIEYGNMVHNVASIDAVLASGEQLHLGVVDELAGDPHVARIVDAVRAIAQRERGEIVERIPKVLRRVGGYNVDLFDCQNPRQYTEDGRANMAHLLVGSEGTLAYSRQITLNLVPIPTHRVLGIVNCSTFHQAMDVTQHIVKLAPTAVELVDRTMIELAAANPAFEPVIKTALIGRPEAILLVEFAGCEHAPLLAKLKALDALMGDLGQPDCVVQMPAEASQKALWEVRKAGLNIMMSMKGDGKPVSFIEDCAVPLEHLASYTASLTEIFHRHGTEGTWYAHASVGTLHVRPILDMRRDGAMKMRSIAEEAAALVRQFKGAYSGEHGDGLCRGEWVSWQYGPKINEAFREIKRVFDPENRFSPNKIIDPPKMDDARNFRVAPGYHEIPLKPALDWSTWNVQRDPLTGAETAAGSGGDRTGGLAKAVDMCNGNGHCRKFDAGTMCPSFRITRDEQHVTRGRASVLRQALAGEFGGEGLASRDVKEALDLCVSCKGCKRECPTGVDMAKLKIEARSAWTRMHGLSWRDRAIAYLPRYAAKASRLSALANALGRIPLFKRAMGLAPQRSLPQFGAPFLQQHKARDVHAPLGKSVLLFVDTFNDHIEPENARAAQRVLEAAGYTVHLNTREGERPLCCGRTFLSAGLVDQARQEARRTLDTLMPLVERGISVVGLEPSCLLSMRDEFLNYGYGAEAKRLSESAFLLEEFLVRERKAGRLVLDLQPLDAKQAWVHGHCHQKAFGAFTPVQDVLQWIPELKVNVINSSCCGMAGSFGYETEHYAASQAMAEAALLPAVRAAGADSIVVADGTSCRHQIHDGAQREAWHVARVLDAALARRTPRMAAIDQPSP